VSHDQGVGQETITKFGNATTKYGSQFRFDSFARHGLFDETAYSLYSRLWRIVTDGLSARAQPWYRRTRLLVILRELFTHWGPSSTDLLGLSVLAVLSSTCRPFWVPSNACVFNRNAGISSALPNFAVSFRPWEHGLSRLER